MKNAVRVDHNALADFAAAVLAAPGVAPDQARTWAEVLVWANLRGVDSHGVLRIPGYVDRLTTGGINPRPDMRIVRRAGAVAVLEADRAPGPVALDRAMGEAIAIAREVHVGWCAARDITHAGAVGYFAIRAAEAGMAGIVLSASVPLMAYHGAKVAGVSTNPVAIAVPVEGRRPLVVDMSTSTVALGKILSARDRGEPIPEGWGMDADGNPVTDPDAVATLLPLGGAKGSGLSLLIECLASLTVANPVIQPALTGRLAGLRLNGTAIAVDLAAFGDPDAFRHEAALLADAVTSLPRAKGVDRLYAPGERGDALLDERCANGIPLPQGTWARLTETAARYGIPMPATPEQGHFQPFT
jgi:ureidoglycolate dehydrogenase (NAD+)